MNYSGMTLNERLFVSELMDKFETAVIAKDRKTLIDILEKVDIKFNEAEGTIDMIFSNPKKYGFPER